MPILLLTLSYTSIHFSACVDSIFTSPSIYTIIIAVLDNVLFSHASYIALSLVSVS